MNKKTLLISSIVLLISTIVMSILFGITKKKADGYSDGMALYAESTIDSFDFIECILDYNVGLTDMSVCNIFFDKLETVYVGLHEAGLDGNYTIIAGVYVPNIYNIKGYTMIIDYMDYIKFDNLDGLKSMLLEHDKLAEDIIAHFNS